MARNTDFDVDDFDEDDFEYFDDWDNFEDYFPEGETFGESEYEE